MGLWTYFRLAGAGYVLAREGAFSLADGRGIKGPAATVIRVARLVERRKVGETARAERLSAALQRLGPVYVKLGQLLATRADIVGPVIAEDLAGLQDKLPPFDQKLVSEILTAALGDHAELLSRISAPVAAASVAQVHSAILTHPDGTQEKVAIKLLRPDIDVRFKKDLATLRTGANLLEFFVRRARRLRPRDVVDTLERSAMLEMDLRMEAAAVSELADNTSDDDGFDIPTVHWLQTARNVMVTSWIDGIPIRDFDALDAAGLDRTQIAANLMQHFLRHAIRDGYFHADMHPGNLFVDPENGHIRAVDFGIMGRIGKRERKFLAEILLGFIRRDYRRIAELHFDIGYVPANQSIDDFAQAMRSIGEPLAGRTADEISMARLLAQLLDNTALFEMQTRPELVMLQKSMVLVEGVARSLDPKLNIWAVSEPVASVWARRYLGPVGKAEDMLETASGLLASVQKIPGLIQRWEDLIDESAKKQRPDLNSCRRLAIFCAGVASAVVVLGVIAIAWNPAWNPAW